MDAQGSRLFYSGPRDCQHCKSSMLSTDEHGARFVVPLSKEYPMFEVRRCLLCLLTRLILWVEAAVLDVELNKRYLERTQRSTVGLIIPTLSSVHKLH